MVVESPAAFRVVMLCDGLADVVEQCRPAEPYIVGSSGNAVEHCHGVFEIVLMSTTLHHLYALHVCQLRGRIRSSSPVCKQFPAYRGARCRHDLEKFVFYALGGDDAYPVGVACDGAERLRVNIETELRCETDSAHHAQRVVAERYVGVEGSADDAPVEVAESVIAVDEFTESVGIDAYRHCVDGEIASRQVVVEGTVFDNRVARVVAVRLTACAYKLQFELPAAHLSRTETAVDGNMCSFAECLSDSLGKFYARAYGDEIDVFGMPVQQ